MAGWGPSDSGNRLHYGARDAGIVISASHNPFMTMV